MQFEVTDASQPTTKIIILQNGVPAVEIDVALAPGEIVDAGGPVRRYSELIFLEPGDNKLSIVAENDVARSAAAEEVLGLSTLTLPVEHVSLPPAGGTGSGEVAAALVESPEFIEEDLTRGRVTGAELNITLEVAEGDDPLTITAIRNHETVWVAEAGPGVGFDSQLIVPLQRGYNNIEVFAEGNAANGVLFSGQVDATPYYTLEPDDTEVGLPGQPGPDEPPPGPHEVPDQDSDRVHVVSAGETLRFLARRYYGHESRYPLIFEANPQLVDLDRLLDGVELVIPVLQTGTEDDTSTDEVDLAGWHTTQEVTARPLRDPAGPETPAAGVVNTFSGDAATIEQQPFPQDGNRKGTGGTPRDLPPVSDSDVPNLYLLSIGVSNLASRSEGFTNLSWPGDDAAAIADRFVACEGDQFGKVHQIGLGPRNVIEGANATKVNIEQAVADLAAAVKARAAQKRADRVGTTDVTVLFFSGHGMSRVAGEGEQEGLFLVPHDYDQDRWQETSVSLLGIAETLCTLPKTELIIFIDACRSGFAGTDFAQRIKPEQFGKRVEAISPRTIYVLSSTARDLDSWEFGLKYPYDAAAPDRRFVGHGLFTHAILKRMDEADSANRGLSVLELGAAVHRQFETWRSWKAFADIDVRQDPWYQFHRSVRHFEFYRKSR
jgi:nucleoid-associated protein YgaU